METKSSPINNQLGTRPSILWWLSSQNKFSVDKIPTLKLLSQEFEILNYGLGDKIPLQSKSPDGKDLAAQYFYVVCEGRARLLGFDTTRKREVSTNLVSEGEVFGGQSLWQESALPYEVRAGSKIQVARISVAKLQPFFKQLPELAIKWRFLIHEQQKSIFFKTVTELRSLSSQRLKQLLPYLTEKKIRAGTRIAAKEERVRFWLRDGRVKDRAFKSGDSWGKLADADSWIAQTNVLFYELSLANWQAFCELAPKLASSWGHNYNSQSSQLSTTNIVSNVNTLSHVRPADALVEREPEVTQAEIASTVEQQIEYPKPLKRRRLWKTYPHIEQQSSSDCGAACLAMISRYWGQPVSINYLRELIGIGRSGASLKNLAAAAESLGYHARPVRASLNKIIDRKNPWIAHWNGEHYVVVYRVKNNKFLVADPATEKSEVSRTEFLACWTGFALLLEPTENLTEAPTEKRSLTQFLSLLLPYRSIGGMIILASFLIQILGLISPLFTQIILDQVVVNRSQSTLNVLVVGMLMFGALGIGLTSIRNYLLSYLANRLDLTMIAGFINHALNLPLKFFESRRVGDIITRVQENQKIQQFLIQNVLLSWLDFLTGFVYLALMLYYNWQLTALILLLIPPIVLLTLAATPLLRKVSRERFNATRRSKLFSCRNDDGNIDG